jgi:uncharacterized protein
MNQFVADFESYMPAEYNGQPYGKAGLLATADEAGIEVSVVFPGGVPADPREVNAHLLQKLKGESRLLPGCLVNPTMGAGGARTVKLMAALHGYRYDAPCVDPVMELARSLGIPATIHSGSPLSGCSPEYIGRLAKRHPEVVIIMDHMGYREWVNLALQAAVENPNIYLGTTLIAAVEPIIIKDIVRGGKIGADRIVFGSNAPSGLATHGVNGIRLVGFTAEEEAAILGENLKRIYRL